ncbi:MAG: hypothetical protein LH632_21155 [Rhodoferax sp.]|nr:hypothetical protein [Rhodoferax sp.]
MTTLAKPAHCRKTATWSWLRTTLVIAGVCCESVGAMSIREMRGLEQSDQKNGAIYVRYFLVGAMEGAVEANAQAVRLGAKPLFCLNGRRMEPYMAKPLFDAELRRNVGIYEADMPVQLVLVNALAASYSC